MPNNAPMPLKSTHWLKTGWNSFMVAWQLMTILPLPYSVSFEKKTLGFSVFFYPIIGVVLGGLVWLGVYAASLWLDNIWFQGAVALTCMYVLTGAIHLDGYMDTLDGYFSRYSGKPIQTVMRDPHVGGLSVIFTVLFLLLKWLLLVEVLIQQTAWLLPIVMMFSRVVVLFCMAHYPCVSQNGLAYETKTHIPKNRVLYFAAVLTGLSFIFLKAHALLLVLLLIGFLANRTTRKHGGLSGDNYGFFLEITQFFLLLMHV